MFTPAGVSGTVKRAAVNVSDSGDNTIVAAVTDKRIKVLSGIVVFTGAVAAKWVDGAAGTDLTGPMSFAANGGFEMAPAIAPGAEWLVTSKGNALVLNLSGAVAAEGWITYVEGE